MNNNSFVVWLDCLYVQENRDKDLDGLIEEVILDSTTQQDIPFLYEWKTRYYERLDSFRDIALLCGYVPDELVEEYRNKKLVKAGMVFNKIQIDSFDDLRAMVLAWSDKIERVMFLRKEYETKQANELLSNLLSYATFVNYSLLNNRKTYADNDAEFILIFYSGLTKTLFDNV